MQDFIQVTTRITQGSRVKRRVNPTSADVLFLWELWCAGSGHSAGFHARVILNGAACRLGELGDVRDVLGVLRILVSW